MIRDATKKFRNSMSLEIAFFLLSVWTSGRIFRAFHAPIMLGEILAGVLLGPEVWGSLPYSTDYYDECVAVPGVAGSIGSRFLESATGANTCTLNTEQKDALDSIFSLAGNAGVALMIMESGMHLHFDKIKEM